MRKRLLGVVLAVGGLLALAVFNAPDLKAIRPSLEPVANAEVERTNQLSGLNSCFWVGTVSPSTLNILFPDAGALYWVTQVRLPKGAKLALEGQYPHARHMSFNAYVGGAPVDRINDLLIPPLPGASNPFLPGAARDSRQRGYRVEIAERALVPGEVLDDASRQPGTLYVPQGENLQQLYYRVYVPDQGLDIQGGVPLPEPLLTLADGQQLRGEALCKAVVVRDAAINDVRAPAEALNAMKQIAGATSPYHPAQLAPAWNAFFNAPLAATNLLQGTPYALLRQFMDSTRRGGFFSTIDNTYMSTYVDNRIGDVLVLQAKAPTTPHTRSGETTMQAAQLRYWSLCKYRSLSDTAVDGCLYDEQVPVDAAGDYTIVVSTAAQRPANARAECGVAWLDWGTAGDGIGNPHGGFLVFRHMMPAADFTRSLFATHKPGEEQQVLGEFYPRPRYQSRAEFEQRGCKR
ncbi:hypothetical protein [Pseudomonas sp. N040]|uniref:hypothetical protein n=1 Tax=Pseudomonas sp. N040 TaxID=2785325 RepID=UPI0018A32C49|nr:hypothetical protein [Pseudomonas sp. N040]MBF7731682.1 hypothetical protein [Pseudomonas sp. N040]MBW7015326.1 hypothetical protein [Pseudomonas sp. N040]